MVLGGTAHGEKSKLIVVHGKGKESSESPNQPHTIKKCFGSILFYSVL